MLFNAVFTIFSAKALRDKLRKQEILSVQNYFWRLQKAHNLFLQLYPAKTFLISVRLLSHPLALI
jgi:hypothetical protein